MRAYAEARQVPVWNAAGETPPVGFRPVWTGVVQLELRRERDNCSPARHWDLQCAWLLVLFCASLRANYLPRMLPPGATEAVAREHDAAVCAVAGFLPPQPLFQQLQRLAQLPLQFGGLGVRSAVDAAAAAYWASWAGCLPTFADHSSTGTAGSRSFGPRATVLD